jgi:hypothetical protein
MKTPIVLDELIYICCFGSPAPWVILLVAIAFNQLRTAQRR